MNTTRDEREGGFRFRSERAYRRWLERHMRAFEAGEISPGMLNAATQATRTGVELLITERTLAAHGIIREEGDHPLGEDGGLGFVKPIEHRKTKVTLKTGMNKRGEFVDERSVSVEGSAADPLVEEDAADVLAATLM